MERWIGKVTVVTGASAGIGAAIVEELVNNGCIVVGMARRKEKIEELALKIKSKNGKLHAIKADISVEEDVINAFKWIRDNLGPIHILINNAGIGRPANLIDGEIMDFKNVLDTNIFGLVVSTREAVRDMVKHDIEGYIININSTMGHRVYNLPDTNVYTATKYAVTALTETLRNDLKLKKCKVRVSSVSPGLVDTDIFAANGYLKSEETVELLKLLPKLQSKDVADAIIYLLGTPPHVEITELTIVPRGGYS